MLLPILNVSCRKRAGMWQLHGVNNRITRPPKSGPTPIFCHWKIQLLGFKTQKSYCIKKSHKIKIISWINTLLLVLKFVLYLIFKCPRFQKHLQLPIKSICIRASNMSGTFSRIATIQFNMFSHPMATQIFKILLTEITITEEMEIRTS